MARINIEDSLESHFEFKKLTKLLGGDHFRAIGMLVDFFRLAQSRYMKDETISLKELEERDLTLLIEAGWAVAFGEGFVCKAADKHFGWLKQRVESGRKGGVKSGKKRRNIKNEAPLDSAEAVLDSAKALLDFAEAKRSGTKPLTLTPSLSPTHSLKPFNTTTTVLQDYVDGPDPLVVGGTKNPVSNLNTENQSANEPTELNKANWRKAFGDEIVNEFLDLALCSWQNLSPYEKVRKNMVSYVHNYLENRAKSGKQAKSKRVKTVTEMIAAGEID